MKRRWIRSRFGTIVHRLPGGSLDETCLQSSWNSDHCLIWLASGKRRGRKKGKIPTVVVMSRCGWLQSTTVWLEAIELCYHTRIWGVMHHDRPVHLSFRAWHHVMILRSFFESILHPLYYIIIKSLVHRSIRHARIQSHRIHQLYPLVPTADPRSKRDDRPALSP
ncbi:hypothetical protein BDW42DRAFT_175469 [Aspergillus taichungensis]|uniref:Uncharacterized protein n=1 Tax=Aspergillus taichungensis TaxID=482145 RepID=A0A2J5HLU5_9EURO|nr:hypothetical protein BDW42DRAFT_175469 [Aspergillus taichungensis]